MSNDGKGDIETLAKKPGKLFDDTASGDLPSKLIKANQNFEEALANCVIRDENHRNAIVLYHAHLAMFKLTEEIETLTNFLNGSISIGGYSRVLSASAHIGMLHPSALGVHLSKEGEKAWAEAAQANKRNKDRAREDEDRGT